MPAINPMLWFDTAALEAAEFYVSLFANSRIINVSHYGGGPRAGEVMMVGFELDGREFSALNGGPEFHFSEAISLFINCADQAEVDKYWAALTDGGEEGQCGWCKDRFGLSWQVIPEGLGAALGNPDPERAQRAVAAMMTMSKIDLAALQAAADG